MCIDLILIPFFLIASIERHESSYLILSRNSGPLQPLTCAEARARGAGHSDTGRVASLLTTPRANMRRLSARCTLTLAGNSRALTTAGPAGITTLQREVTSEDLIKKSRFVAFAAPVLSTDTARAYIRNLSEPRANHNCFAWRLADGTHRSSGDGEPSGTAGPPILSAIENAGLHNVVVVVQRFFGGVKLGTGGLARAYGGAAAACLRGAERVHQPNLTGMNVRFALSDTGAVYAALGRYNPREIRRLSNGWAELHFEAPPEQVPVLASALREATHGRVALGPERSEEGACRLTELGYLQCENADNA